MQSRIDRHFPLLLAIQLVGVAVVAWLRRFMLDDAFIALRYAEHFVAGHGLVWNVGERVEGYTSLLWTLVLALPLWLGWDPILFIYVLGVLLVTCTLACTARLALNLFESRGLALAVSWLVGSNASFLAYATGGLETQLLALLITLLFALSTWPGPLTPRRALALSLVTAACLGTRLDSALPAGCAWLWVGRELHKQRQDRFTRAWWSTLLNLSLPCLVLIGAWLSWKLSFYGDVLPNTFYAKVSGSAAWRNGAHFLTSFAHSYLLWPCLLLLLAAAPRLVRRSPASAAVLLALMSSYLYIASVGGDFMEFRFMVPTLPLLMCAIVGSAHVRLGRQASQALVIVLVSCGSLYHALTFRYRGGIESVSELAYHLQPSGHDWIGVGKALRADLPAHSDVRIATTAAGAIPFYAQLPALDMLGLTDRWTARHGVQTSAQLGHTRLAPVAYLVERGVHLAFAHPMLTPPLDPRHHLRFEIIATFPYFVGVSRDTVPADAALVSIPLSPRRVVLAVQLRPHPHIDAAVRSGRWRRFALAR